jgi:hypothetical protein
MWKNDEVTKHIFALLKQAREEVNLALTNADIVLGENSDRAIPRLIGQREGLDLLLEISYEDLEEVEDED